MIKPLSSWSPLQLEKLERKQAEVRKFFEQYPHPFGAWIERQRSAGVREYWMFRLHDIPQEIGTFIACDRFGGQEIKVPTWRQLNITWFRAAQCLVDERQSNERLLCANDLVKAFHIPPSQFQNYTDAEHRWLRSHKMVVSRVQEIPPCPYLVKQFDSIRRQMIDDLDFSINYRLSLVK
jgi:hypothetical protein